MCPFKLLTGVPCPGCGMTRAYLHLFEGDIQGAFISSTFLAHSFASVTCHFSGKSPWFSVSIKIATFGLD